MDILGDLEAVEFNDLFSDYERLCHQALEVLRSKPAFRRFLRNYDTGTNK